MTNNDVLRNLCETFDFNEDKVVEIFALAEQKISSKQVSSWLKKANDPELVECDNKTLSVFLNGLISEKRGKKEGSLPEPDKIMTNNIVLKKLKIALDLKNEDVLELLALSGQSVNSYELTSYFRKPGHKNYRPCKNPMLRAFLKAIQLKLNPTKLEK